MDIKSTKYFLKDKMQIIDSTMEHFYVNEAIKDFIKNILKEEKKTL